MTKAYAQRFKEHNKQRLGFMTIIGNDNVGYLLKRDKDNTYFGGESTYMIKDDIINMIAFLRSIVDEDTSN
jgi:hypothetical protein